MSASARVPMSASAHVACADCERIRPGLVAQPVNTMSSLAYVGAAIPIWRRAAITADRPWQAVAVSAVVAGLGSASYHGPGGRPGKAVHDLGVTALAVTVAGALGHDARRGGPRDNWSAAVVGLVALAVHATSRTGGPLCRPDSRLQGHAVWHVLSAVALVLAARGTARRSAGQAHGRPEGLRPSQRSPR